MRRYTFLFYETKSGEKDGVKGRPKNSLSITWIFVVYEAMEGVDPAAFSSSVADLEDAWLPTFFHHQ